MSPSSETAEKTSIVEVGTFAHDEEGGAEKPSEPQNDVRIRHVKSEEEKRLVRKQDMLILPLLSLALFFGYLVCLSPISLPVCVKG